MECCNGAETTNRFVNLNPDMGISAVRVERWIVLTVLLALVGVMMIPGTVAGQEKTEQEPNDDRANATKVTPGETITGSIATNDDTDYYSFQATAGQTINLTGVADSSAGVRFKLKNAAGNNLGGVSVSTSPEYGGLTAPYTGTYYIHTTKIGTGELPNYELTLRLAETTDREPNEDRGNATKLSLNASIEDTISPGDRDWYELSVDKGDSIDVSGTVIGSNGAVDFRLKMANGTNFGGQGNVAGGNSYAFNATAPYTGAFYISVTRSSRPGPDYTMDVRTNGTRAGTEKSSDQDNGSTQADSDGDGPPVVLLLLASVVILLVIVLIWYRQRAEQSPR
jgi:hypothetical protein